MQGEIGGVSYSSSNTSWVSDTSVMLLFMDSSCARRDKFEDRVDVAINKSLKHHIEESRVQKVHERLGNVTQTSKCPKCTLKC